LEDRLMRKALATTLAGLGAVMLTGAATAASQTFHTLTVPLPDGSSVRVDYVGDVAPKVTVNPAPIAPFGIFDRSAFDMHRQIDAMMREIEAMTSRPIAAIPGANVAAYGGAPAGSTSVTVVSTSNGGVACTRTTEVTSQGPGKPPKVVSNVSGNCAASPAAPAKPVT
jgi:hypothetical protein